MRKRSPISTSSHAGRGAGPDGWCAGPNNSRVTGVNPYLRWPVVLDEYTKNRQVWNCASAKLVTTPYTIIGGGNWLQQFESYGAEVWGDWETGGLGVVCAGNTYPSGWGGDVIDSFLQNEVVTWGSGGSGDIFQIGIGTMESALAGTKTSAVNDPAKALVAADCVQPIINSPSYVAFAQACGTQCGSTDDGCCNGGVAGADDASYVAAEDKKAIYEGGAASKYARHLGGSNIGFMDGHASWWPAQRIIASSGYNYNWGANQSKSDGSMEWNMTCESFGSPFCAYAY